MAMGSKLISNSVLTSVIEGKESMTLKLQNDGGGRRVIEQMWQVSPQSVPFTKHTSSAWFLRKKTFHQVNVSPASLIELS